MTVLQELLWKSFLQDPIHQEQTAPVWSSLHGLAGPARTLLQGQLSTSCNFFLATSTCSGTESSSSVGFCSAQSSTGCRYGHSCLTGGSPGPAGQAVLQSLEHLLPLLLHWSECLWGCFSLVVLVLPLTAATECVFLFLNCIPQRCPYLGCRAQLCYVVGLLEPSGMGWNWSCPAQDSPKLSSQRLPCSPPRQPLCTNTRQTELSPQLGFTTSNAI